MQLETKVMGLDSGIQEIKSLLLLQQPQHDVDGLGDRGSRVSSGGTFTNVDLGVSRYPEPLDASDGRFWAEPRRFQGWHQRFPHWWAQSKGFLVQKYSGQYHQQAVIEAIGMILAGRNDDALEILADRFVVQEAPQGGDYSRFLSSQLLNSRGKATSVILGSGIDRVESSKQAALKAAHAKGLKTVDSHRERNRKDGKGKKGQPPGGGGPPPAQ